MDEKKMFPYLFFTTAKGIGPSTFATLISIFGDAQKAYDATAQELTQYLGPTRAAQIIEHKKNWNVKAFLEKLSKEQIGVITQIDSSYPKDFLHLSDAPIVLFTKGNQMLLDGKYMTAIVGTRSPSQYGVQVTKDIVRHLALYNHTIVSGLALGVDAIAHAQAMDSGLNTIGFLGCGIDVVYPQENSKIFERMIKSNNLIVSEFPPGIVTNKGLFVSRNRLVAAISSIIIVSEGKEKSGALITAHLAAEYGKEVFAVPGSIYNASSAACHQLIKEGAKLLANMNDLLAETDSISSVKDYSQLNELQVNIITELNKGEGKNIDELTHTLNIDARVIISELSMLELDGFVQKTLQGEYVLV
jgi:DNA processing protein